MCRRSHVAVVIQLNCADGLCGAFYPRGPKFKILMKVFLLFLIFSRRALITSSYIRADSLCTYN